MADVAPTEVVLGIRWKVGIRTLLGAQQIVLGIEHPRLGSLDFLISSRDAMDFAAALAKMAERRDEARMQDDAADPS